MTNALFDAYKELLLGGAGQDMNSETAMSVSLIDHATTVPLPGTHDFWDDLSSAEVGTTQVLTSTTIAAGVFDAANVTWPTVTGVVCASIVIWFDTATPATSNLIAYLDTGITGLPVTPSGGDINLNWDATGIFSI